MPQSGIHDRTDFRVHMDRKDTGHIVTRGNGFYRSRNVHHARTKILPAVGGNPDNFTTAKPGLQRREANDERRVVVNSL